MASGIYPVCANYWKCIACKKGIEDFEVMQVFSVIRKKKPVFKCRQIENAAGEQLILVAI